MLRLNTSPRSNIQTKQYAAEYIAEGMSSAADDAVTATARLAMLAGRAGAEVAVGVVAAARRLLNLPPPTSCSSQFFRTRQRSIGAANLFFAITHSNNTNPHSSMYSVEEFQSTRPHRHPFVLPLVKV
ncbi:hypothetical protein V3C99_017214 [Haemonchus contortus]